MNVRIIQSLRVAAAVLAVVCAGSVRADYFVSWRIDAEDAVYASDSSQIAFAYATMTVKGGGQSYTLTDSGGNYVEFFSDEGAYSISSTSDAERNLGTQARWAVDSSSGGFADYRFQVQLWGDEGQLAVSEVRTLAELQGNLINCVNPDVTKTVGDGVWVVKNFTAVPEPTSGLLLLLGVAGLALKRKRA